MSEINQAEFKGWARVEVMGHQSHTGYVTTEAYGAAVLFRIDQPEIPEAEETLTESQWIGNTTLPAGTVVKRGAIEAVSVLVGAGSIYRIIPCTKEVAEKAIRENQRRPLIAVKLPGAKQLADVKAGSPEDIPPEAGFDCCGGDLIHGHELGCPTYDGGDRRAAGRERG